jgi:two-component system nitrate/nitrite response regulator NarL
VTRLLLISPVSLYREGLAELLGRRPNIRVVAAVTDVDSAVGILNGTGPEPDIVLLDMAGPESVGAARRLVELAPDVRVLAVAVPNTETQLLACVETGLAGFVTPEASLEDLIAAVESVARGELLCSPALAGALGRRVAALARARAEQPPAAVPLTTREREIAALIDEGLSNKEIARRLQIELPTVKNHVHHILEKLGVHRRAEAAALIRGRAQLIQTD